MQTFKLKQYHLDLARRLHVSEGPDDGPAIDATRPYRNRSVAEDIAEFIGEPWPDEDALDAAAYDAATEEIYSRMMAIHAEMVTALQIIIGLAGEAVRLGTYANMTKYGRPVWVRLGAMVPKETSEACGRVAAAMANSLWLLLSTESLAEWVGYGHEPDEDGEAAHETLWDAVYGRCLTTAVANHDHDIPFLQRPPEDKHHAKGSR